MPTRLFDQLDVINIVQGYTVGPGTVNAVITLNNIQFANFSLSGSGSLNNTGAGGGCSAVATYQKTGNFDFQSVGPPIGVNDTISKVTVRVTAAMSGDAAATTGGAGLCNATITDIANTFLFPDISNSQTSQPISAHVSGSNSVNTSSDVIFDPPISYSAFVASFGSLLFQLVLNVSATKTGSPAGTTAILYNNSITNYSIEVTWQEAPFPFQLQSPDNPIQTDDVIKITGGPTNPITIKYKDSGGNPHTINITGTPDGDGLDIVIPDITVDQPVVIYFFVGSAYIGSLITIYFTDGSGIYEFVPGQAFDILYDQKNPPDTVTVKIPNPFGKSGFIGG